MFCFAFVLKLRGPAWAVAISQTYKILSINLATDWMETAVRVCVRRMRSCYKRTNVPEIRLLMKSFVRLRRCDFATVADPTGGQWDHWSDLPDLYDDDEDETTALKPRKRFFATCEKERRLSAGRGLTGTVEDVRSVHVCIRSDMEMK